MWRNKIAMAISKINNNTTQDEKYVVRSEFMINSEISMSASFFC